MHLCCKRPHIEINEYKCFMITLAKSSCDNDCNLRGTCHPILQFKSVNMCQGKVMSLWRKQGFVKRQLNAILKCNPENNYKCLEIDKKLIPDMIAAASAS